MQVDEALGGGGLGGLGRLGAEVGLEQAEGGAHDGVAPGLVVAAAEDAVLLHGEALLEQLQRVLRVDHDHVGGAARLQHGDAAEVDGQRQAVLAQEVEGADALLGQAVVEQHHVAGGVVVDDLGVLVLGVGLAQAQEGLVQRDDVLAQLDVQQRVGQQRFLEHALARLGLADVPRRQRVDLLVDLVRVADHAVVVELLGRAREHAAELEAQRQALAADVLVRREGVLGRRARRRQLARVLVELVVVDVARRVDVVVQRAEDGRQAVVEGRLQVVALDGGPDAPPHLLVEGRDLVRHVAGLAVQADRDGVLRHGAGVLPEALLLHGVDPLGEVDEAGDLVVDQATVLLALPLLPGIDGLHPPDRGRVRARHHLLELVRQLRAQAAGDAHDGQHEGGEGGVARLGGEPEPGIVPAEAGDVHDAVHLLELVQVDGHQVVRLFLGGEEGLEREVGLAEPALPLLGALAAVLGAVDVEGPQPLLGRLLHEGAQAGQLRGPVVSDAARHGFGGGTGYTSWKARKALWGPK